MQFSGNNCKLISDTEAHEQSFKNKNGMTGSRQDKTQREQLRLLLPSQSNHN